MGLHHVGIATTDAVGTAHRYARILDVHIAHEESVPDRNVDVVFVGDGPYLEFLEPTGPGPIQRFLDRQGPGHHHVAMGVSDLDEHLEHVQEYDAEPIDDAARSGAWGHRVAFLHPSSMGGVLVELVEL